ncbi:probable carboxylesterase 7 [Beta vulgaris subsp. vulgaris]|uniref:probable carboxylesterase 7 n=1 Tax=Beta vulgaris subsp. vulgaris TaxID=3555 RepID=UPI002037471D|nr:probable carboxylesterase 7 [Beta vulgaris subsp. vulgaris]
MEVHQTSEILHDFSPRLRVYKDGRIERLLKTDSVPPSFDPKTLVHSKDVTISPGLSARIFRPDKFPTTQTNKLPILIYIHGGAFCLYSAYSSIYHNYINSLVSESGCIAISINYRLAPEHPMPLCYDDSLAATQWVLSHSSESGPEPWLNQWADFDRVFLAGDSAGANIAHDIVTRSDKLHWTKHKSASEESLTTYKLTAGVQFAGVMLVHPFFGDDEPNGLWDYLYPGTTGVLDPRLNPSADPARLRREIGGCKRVLVCVGGKDFLRERGVKYYEILREGQENGEWEGELEFMESKGRGHVFHLYKPQCDEAKDLLKRVADFINKSGLDDLQTC